MSDTSNIFVSITGEEKEGWQNKIREINEYGIKNAAVFIERFEKEQREPLYRALLKSDIEKVPLVHLRHDATVEEIDFFVNNFFTSYFNIHEETFYFLDKWKKHWNKIYLEMDADNDVADHVKVKEIGGFCIDLAHFRKSVARGAEEAYYIYMRRNDIDFTSNHISGYLEEEDIDMHEVDRIERFDYLKELPSYLFGDVMAIEVDNSIKEQLEFKDYIADILRKREEINLP